ncbi:MAG: peptidylprolyl isomerase, partial [Planctomycetota bacterium]
LARTPVDLNDTSVDLASTFPVLWTARAPRVLYCQLYIDNEPAGAPLVIEPLFAREPRPANLLEDLLIEACEAGDPDAINRLLAISRGERERLRSLPAPDQTDARPLLAGLRVYPLVRVRFETTQGTIDVRVRPDAAPLTVRRFLDLVEDGYYTDVAFHRVVRADGRGRRVLVQTGDPTGTGAGAPGERFEYEPSSLRHAYGVLSIARDPENAHTNGAQFFVVLSDSAGVDFDGRYTAFAEIVEGADALEAIVRVPLGLSDPDDPASPRDRPLEPATIVSARTIDAPPLDTTAPPERRIRPEDETPVVR